MKTKFILAVLLFLFNSFGNHLVAYAGDIHLGVMFNGQHTDSLSYTMRDSLRDLLGFNFCFPMADTTGIPQIRYHFFSDSGLQIIPLMFDSGEPGVTAAYNRYLKAHYAVIHVTDNTPDVRFRTKHGTDVGDWCVAPRSDTPFVFLDDFYYDHERSFWTGEVMQYFPILTMRVDSLPPDSAGISLGSLKVWMVNSWWWNDSLRHIDLVQEYPIVSDSFIGTNSNPHVIHFYPYFTVPNVSDTVRTVLTYQIISTGRYQIAVDSFMVYNNYGKEIMSGVDDNQYFIPYISQHQNVLAWQLRDDMHYDQLLLAKHMDHLIRDNSNGCGVMKPWYDTFDTLFSYDSHMGGRFPFREFLRLADPKRHDLNQYPFWDGKQGNDSCSGGVKTLYYGDSTYNDGFNIGLQWRIKDGMTSKLDSIMPLIRDIPNFKLGYACQAQIQKKYYCDNYSLRRPTGPEMSMEAFIALSYGIKDLWYWPFGTESGGGGDEYIGLDNCYYDTLPCHVTEAWDRIKTHVTRNIEALSSYLGNPALHWERSYDSHHMPAGRFISSLRGWSDSYNPDTGWAQIGEFHNGNDKYILLVNRACSKDDQGTEAPDQHFMLGLNPATISSDYVFITDYTDSLRHAGGDTGWVGIPRTTYSGKMADGTIPYTITLKAGEGKLLKIASTNGYNNRLTCRNY